MVMLSLLVRVEAEVEVIENIAIKLYERSQLIFPNELTNLWQQRDTAVIFLGTHLDPIQIYKMKLNGLSGAVSTLSIHLLL